MTRLPFVDLAGTERERAIPVLRDSFVGIYRWHAKRQLREVDRVRGIVDGSEVVAASLLTKLVPEAGYVYYLAVASARRRQGLGRRLMDDALEWFRQEKVEVVYAAVEDDNPPSLSLFRSAGLRIVTKDESSYLDGGLGARGLRTKMWIVPGELLLGLRLRERAGPAGRQEPETTQGGLSDGADPAPTRVFGSRPVTK
jgi:ribosomal protein S18 acetylase RimI-like enzyme